MGMYTELVVTARIKDDPDTVALINYMIGESIEEPEKLPDSELFTDDTCWQIMLQCSSYYHIPRIVHLFEYDEIGKYWCFHNRSDFKDYSNESIMFFEWLRTVLDDRHEGVMLGYTRYEEDREPIIYYDGE